ncbi:MAG: putative metal-dependent hydrolase, TIM-barrel fold [Chloroflexi bacterium]|nr:MAG: putative metal-dependent hydrolase, TIM-barrel fold [Chloroflexota bacterium]
MSRRIGVAKNGFKVIDSDMHIIEPVDLWERYIDPAFKDRAPMGTARSAGDLNLIHPDGSLWGRDPVRPTDTAKPTGAQAVSVEDRFKDHAARGYSNQVQLEAMDVEGIDVAVIYPSRGLHALGEPNMDPPLAAAVARGYNDWLYDFCQADPKRILGAGMISVFDVNDAIAEAKRSVNELGFRAVFVRPNMVNNRPWHDPYYDPLWATIEELNVPLGFHEAIFTGLPQVGWQFGANFMLRHTFCHPVEQMLASASFAGGGIFHKFPDLKVAFLEGNCSWLPFLLWRLDEHYEQQGDVWAPELTAAPSEYFKKQGYASVEGDEEPVKYVIDWMGNSNLVFSTDYPHGDSKYPHAVERFFELPITDEDKRKILWDNCAEMYGVVQPVGA